MNERAKQRISNRTTRWMLVFLLVIAVSAAGVLAYFKLFPETVVKAPSTPKPPMHNAPN
jgi:lipopolysaccharide export system protein LptC